METALFAAARQRSYPILQTLGRISFEEYANHYLLVFYLTSTHQASHDYLHAELTSASISISLRFDTALAHITEVLLLGETASTIYINNSRKVSKNYYSSRYRNY